MQRIREEVGKVLDINKIVNINEFDPTTAVSLGAAWYAYNQQSSITTDQLFDTIPYPLGFAVNNGKCSTFCHACDPLPIKWHLEYGLQHANQESVDFTIYRGENEYVNLFCFRNG